MFQVISRDGQTLWAECDSEDSAWRQKNRLALENRRPLCEFRIAYPPDHRLPIYGGGTRTALELGLPLVQEECSCEVSETYCPQHGVQAHYTRCAAAGRDSGD